ncbi:MAG: ABC transporter ATP-binding protein [Gemmiger sp.]|nr:ABC transporter ATP-binding protein [Gemmiger sp.]
MAETNNQTHGPGRRMGHGMGRGMGPGEKAKDFKGTLRRLVRELGGYKIAFVTVLVFAVLSTIFNIAGPKILAKATTALATGWYARLTGTGGIDFGYIGKILLFLLGMYLLSAGFSFIQGWVMSGMSQKICYNFRKQISEKINRLPLAYFEKRTVGEVLSRITNDVDTLGQSLNQSVTQLITSITTMVGVLLMMLSISPRMTLIALLILPVSMVLVMGVVKVSQKYFKAQQKYLGDVNGQVEEVYAGHNVVKAFNREDAVLAQFNKDNDKLYESAWKSQFLSGLMMPVMTFVGNLGYVAVAIVGGIFAAQGLITIGDIQAFIQYVKSFTQPIQQLAQVSNMLQSMAAAAERVFEFLAEPEESQTVENPASPQDIDGQVSFNHVKFGYDPNKTIIQDFTCEVKPGQKVAIVGPTGAGKTTMVKLLMRFYDVDGGNITLNGHDLRNFDRTALREGFGMVLQDTWLFKGSIMENIRYGRLDATDAEVIAAAKAAHADHFIRTLPGGYEMELNEDASNVSQGQKQLLTIARAILADNRILILDEATSSVDTRTEQRIQKAMDNLMKGRTSFVIAHRLSTIKDSDLILVMRDGDIVEQGSHDALLAQNGFYADLYNSQFEDVTA